MMPDIHVTSVTRPYSLCIKSRLSPASKNPDQPNYRPCCAEGPDDGDPGMVWKRPVQKNTGHRRGQGNGRQNADEKDGSLGQGHR
ncbi:hypothetical protein JQ626_24560 [Bradyrhizobium diazoefficiens]|nr:hypothetical protein [Bradyrhizobium diazoefficiens]MBR0967242.1 hypothetical protein [Bradyrhizobium diazoefficiens]MBR0977342.1 hypothetical protein [Bradyrhizobium diazoefficiens]MBR1013407.1 hypothetical protein [Bradyrhizobium diazoefficiens]MBR1051664.1 hypothetical protein [Bradyrhizobium diazoefficiens]MBR1061207.1 hypothetical protein [Bradyrhizobium diazoefficiens]